MNPSDKQIEEWNKEFIMYLHDETLIPNNKHDDYFFIDFHYRREWLCFLAAKKSSFDDIEKLKFNVILQKSEKKELIEHVELIEKENLELRALVNFARACFVEQEYPTDIEKEWLSKAEKYKQGE